MNTEEFREWQDKVLENCHILETVAKDRAILKNMMEKYLRTFFDYEKIEWSGDFNRITLKWSHDNDPIIHKELLRNFKMDFIITKGHEKDIGTGIWIEIYPFGLPEEGKIVEI